MIQKIKNFILSHKIITIIALIIIVVGSYFIFKKSASGETRYVTEVVKKGDVSTTVTGTGQVEAQDTIDLKPKVSGDITYVGVKSGQEVKRGALIASVDSRDAKIALENAKIALAKLVGAPDSLTLLQKQNNLTKAYGDGWNSVSSFVIDMNTMLDEVNALYNSDGYFGYQNISGLSSSGRDKISLSEDGYYQAKNSIEEINKLYKTLSVSSSQEEIKDIINKAYFSSKIMANTIKNTEAAFNYMVNYLESQGSASTITTKANINSWTNSSNGYVSSLLSTSNSLDESTLSLEDLLVGADELDIRSAELTVQNKQDAYNDCFVRAPFDGVIATLTAKVGESSGSSIGTLITKQKLATISLNEVDIAKIKLGQKVISTFDAIDNLSIEGEVAEIDSIGTVSQGVVTYNIKISFNKEDDRVKPGMSVSATIVTEEAKDVISVPNTAIKNQKGKSYVEVFNSPLTEVAIKSQGAPSIVLPTQVQVITGLVDDARTEIISGLKEGDIIVIKTITGITITNTTTQAPSLMSAVGGNKTTGTRIGGGSFMPRD